MYPKKKTPRQEQRDQVIKIGDYFCTTVAVLWICAGCIVIIISQGTSIYNSLHQPKIESSDFSKYTTCINWTAERITTDSKLFHEMQIIGKSENMTDLEKAQELLDRYPVFDKRTDFGLNIEKLVDNSTCIGTHSFIETAAGSFHEIEKMKKNQVGVRVWMGYAPCENQQLDVVVTTMQKADMNRRLIEKYTDHMKFCTTTSCVINTSFHKVNTDSKIASLVGAEVGPIILHDLGALRILYHMGVRYVTVTQFCVTLSSKGPHVKPKPILQWSQSGDLSTWRSNWIFELNRIGFIVELNYVNEEMLNLALRLSKAPIILSHVAENIAYRKSRLLNDYPMQLLKSNGGLILIKFNNYFWNNMRKMGTLDDVARHMDFVRKMIGVDFIAVGGVSAGVPIRHQILHDSSRYPEVFGILIRMGWKLEDVRKVAYLNMVRVMEKVEQIKMELE